MSSHLCNTTLAIDKSLKEKIPIQVKTIRGGSWQFNATKFMKITFRGDNQQIEKKVKLPNPDLIHVFVKLGKKYGEDEFYLTRKRDIQDILLRNYTHWLKIHGGKRPKNPRSTHCSIVPKDLEKYRDNWDILKK